VEPEEEVILVCMLEDRKHYPGSRLKTCHKCGQNVWVTPASLAAAGSKAKLTCTQCVGSDVAESMIKDMTEGQLAEISKTVGRKITREEAERIMGKLAGRKFSEL
jgi:hypothetical protein